MSNTHDHCFCIEVKAHTGGTSGIGIGITKDHQRCCMCMQQRVKINVLGSNKFIGGSGIAKGMPIDGTLLL